MRITTPALFLTCLCADLTAIAQAPNDACADAIPISCGITVGGSTSEAMLDPAAGNCGTAVSAAGVWYSIAGTGEVITLSTCPSHTFDTKINVYTGSCGTPSCVTGNDDGGGCGTGSTASFLSEQGTTYLVLIQGYDGQTGDFELSVSCGPVTYDHCQGATPISCNQSLPGSTVEATADAVPFFCVTGIQAPGVWYTFTGISAPILISTCESSDFDTRLNVYSGTCGALACVAGDDDTEGVGLCSTVSLVPDPATTYYILVQGYDGQTGDFLLELACQTCGTPSDVSATASDETAYVFWTSLNPGATYMIEHGPLGFVPGNGVVTTGTVNGNAATAVITGLASGTEYAFYVQEECGPGDEPAHRALHLLHPRRGTRGERDLCRCPALGLWRKCGREHLRGLLPTTARMRTGPCHFARPLVHDHGHWRDHHGEHLRYSRLRHEDQRAHRLLRCTGLCGRLG